MSDDARTELGRRIDPNALEIDAYPFPLDAVDRVVEYLLSEPVVERAAYAMYLDRPLELDQEGGDDWAILPDEWKYEWSEGARAAIEGALGVHESNDPGPTTNHTNGARND
ncbi:MAG: hypothetical protein CMH34_05265 [Microbacterium sp.]|nr:hypothetical protein [Microbacterium sp.]